jgi:predicted Zn-dependent protease
MRQGRLAEARRYFDRLLQSAPPSFVHTRRIYGLLIELTSHEGNHQKAVEVSACGLAHFPGDDYLTYSQAEALYHLGQYQAAGILLAHIVTNTHETRYIREGEPNGIKQRLAPLALGEALRMQGALQPAEWLLRQVAQAYPNDAIVWQYLGRVYVAMSDRLRFAYAMERLSSCPQGQRLALQLTAYWHLQQNELAAAEQKIQQLIEEAPYLAMPRVMRAECLNRRGAPLPAQLEAYREVLRVQPGNTLATSMIQRLLREMRTAAPTSQRQLGTSIEFSPCVPAEAVGA